MNRGKNKEEEMEINLIHKKKVEWVIYMCVLHKLDQRTKVMMKVVPLHGFLINFCQSLDSGHLSYVHFFLSLNEKLNPLCQVTDLFLVAHLRERDAF